MNYAVGGRITTLAGHCWRRIIGIGRQYGNTPWLLPYGNAYHWAGVTYAAMSATEETAYALGRYQQ